MIEIATSTDALEDTGQNPYQIPANQQANPGLYGSPYNDMISLLQRLVDSSETQRVSPRQVQTFLNTLTPFSTTIALKTQLLVITGSAAALIGFQVGGVVQFSFNLGAQDTKILPYITQIGAGVDLLLTTSAGTVTGYLISFPAG